MQLSGLHSAFFTTTLCLLPLMGHAATTKVIFADATYTMADGDTLGAAEGNVLLRAKRKAIEEAGVYLEAVSLDSEKHVNGKTSRINSYEIRTVTAAITETDILEMKRSFEGDRPVFSVRIRAVVNLDKLEEAIRRFRSEEQLARHYSQLQRENAQLRSMLSDLTSKPPGVRTVVIEPNPQSEPRERTKTLVRAAMQTPNLREKIDLATQAVAADDHAIDAYIVRGQAYLRIVSAAFSDKSPADEFSRYLEKARADFDHALTFDPSNTWALLGRADTATWYKRQDHAASDYEQILKIDPLFDVARQRLITLYTTRAREQAAAKHWHEALSTLEKLLEAQTAESWLPDKKEAYLLRSSIFARLHQTQRAIDDLSLVVRIDPDNGQAFLSRAKLYKELLQGRLAKDDFERACVLGASPACEELP